MRFINQFRNYLLDEEFGMSVFQDKVDIMNYTSIGHFDSNKVIVKYDGGEVLITGKKLVVSKLLHDEVLILGVIQNVELR